MAAVLPFAPRKSPRQRDLEARLAERTRQRLALEAQLSEALRKERLLLDQIAAECGATPPAAG